MEGETLDQGCPDCGDVAVETERIGAVSTMQCADPNCGRTFTLIHQ